LKFKNGVAGIPLNLLGTSKNGDNIVKGKAQIMKPKAQPNTNEGQTKDLGLELKSEMEDAT